MCPSSGQLTSFTVGLCQASRYGRRDRSLALPTPEVARSETTTLPPYSTSPLCHDPLTSAQRCWPPSSATTVIVSTQPWRLQRRSVSSPSSQSIALPKASWTDPPIATSTMVRTTLLLVAASRTWPSLSPEPGAIVSSVPVYEHGRLSLWRQSHCSEQWHCIRRAALRCSNAG